MGSIDKKKRVTLIKQCHLQHKSS